jgi:hypothetical protein
MENLALTLNQKRFLIIWTLFHSFALFVNLAGINGFVTVNDHEYVCIFANTLPGETYGSGFWPFVNFSPNYQEMIFNGIFYSYGFAEYVFYMLLSIGILFVPKLWSNPQNLNTMSQQPKSLKEIKLALEQELTKYDTAYPFINNSWELDLTF